MSEQQDPKAAAAEERRERIAAIKAENAANADRTAKMDALMAEMSAQGAISPAIAERIFEDKLHLLTLKGGVVYGVAEMVGRTKEKFPEIFGHTTRRGAPGPQPDSRPRGMGRGDLRNRNMRINTSRM